MKLLIICSIIILLHAVSISAVGYYHHNGGYYHHNHHNHHGHHGHHKLPCETQECPEGYVFNITHCGCFKIGEELPTLDTPLIRPLIPIRVPIRLPIRVPTNRCGRLTCASPLVLNQQTCRCECLVRITQCPGRTTYNPNTCTCECINTVPCNFFQTFNQLLCTCEGVIPLGPFPTICPPSQCSSLQRLNPTTCQCECSLAQQASCLFPQVIDPFSCECVCDNRLTVRCGINQRFNEDTCECECINVFVTVERRLPQLLNTFTERQLVPAPCPAGTFLNIGSCECL